jgi:transcriptional regulator with XRE-family HTH domain
MFVSESRMATTGDRIREIRQARGLTQDQVASKAGLSKGFLSDVENNKTDIGSTFLLKIADALAASIDYLLRGNFTEQGFPQKAVEIPPELSETARESGWTYAETLEVLRAHNSVVAHRTKRSVKQLSKEHWKSLHAAIKTAFS